MALDEEINQWNVELLEIQGNIKIFFLKKVDSTVDSTAIYFILWLREMQ